MDRASSRPKDALFSEQIGAKFFRELPRTSAVKGNVQAAAQLTTLDELDELTLKRAQRGDDRACRDLVLAYQRRVFALLGRLLGRSPMVEDLAQETFLRVFRALPAFSPSGPARLSTWILTIATRLALDELRKRRPQAAAVELAQPPEADARALGRAIENAVAALPPEFRAAFLLREYHGLEYDEIARALDVDLGTVKSRLSRARSQLREALKDE
jgi:RNA polymerase sigma-70 factor (ECF subfamily)